MIIPVIVAAAAFLPFVIKNIGGKVKSWFKHSKPAEKPPVFRDPAGQIVIRDGAIIREVNPSGRADYKLFMESQLYAALRAELLIISHAESEDEMALP